MLLDAGVVAGLIFIFARYNAEGGFLRAFLMLLGVLIISFLIAVALPESLLFLFVPIYVLLLAAGLTFMCGTQPRQTGKIIGGFLLFKFIMWGIPAFLASQS